MPLVMPDPYTRVEVRAGPQASCILFEILYHLCRQLGVQQTTVDRVQQLVGNPLMEGLPCLNSRFVQQVSLTSIRALGSIRESGSYFMPLEVERP
jgi:hypothetical protein